MELWDSWLGVPGILLTMLLCISGDIGAWDEQAAAFLGPKGKLDVRM